MKPPWNEDVQNRMAIADFAAMLEKGYNPIAVAGQMIEYLVEIKRAKARYEAMSDVDYEREESDRKSFGRRNG